jgi:hypothetical protein
MDAVFKKLNFKAQKEIVSINSPKSFDVNLNAMKEFANITTKIPKEIDFFIGFATKQEELNKMINDAAPNIVGDAVFWLCYPKMSSKKYTCEFNRDTGWAELGKYNMEPVRGVAIDEDWSALRFRKIEYIKNFTRGAKHAISEKGKEKANKD